MSIKSDAIGSNNFICPQYRIFCSIFFVKHLTPTVNSSNNQGEFKHLDDNSTVPSTGQSKQSKSELPENQVIRLEIINSLGMESEVPVNSISEIPREQRAGWLRHGDRVVRFASVRPFEGALSANTTPSNSLESEETRNYEYSDRINNFRHNHNSSNTNYYQNGPIYQEPNLDDRIPINFLPPPNIHPLPPIFGNGHLQHPFSTVSNAPLVPHAPYGHPQVFHGHINPPLVTPNHQIPYYLSQPNNVNFPTLVGYSCYPTVVDFAVTRRVLYPPLNHFVPHGDNQLNHDYQQPHHTQYGVTQSPGFGSPQQDNVGPNVETNSNSDIIQITMDSQTNELNIFIDNGGEITNIQEQLRVSSGGMVNEVDVGEENIGTNIPQNINISQENVPNRDMLDN
uniref:Velvet domain-containing protein n=1 Tax=Strongyloides venezuelensis TaxID=75913 RepID=A0A0K0FR96_STRVS